MSQKKRMMCYATVVNFNSTASSFPVSTGFAPVLFSSIQVSVPQEQTKHFVLCTSQIPVGLKNSRRITRRYLQQSAAPIFKHTQNIPTESSHTHFLSFLILFVTFHVQEGNPNPCLAAVGEVRHRPTGRAWAGRTASTSASVSSSNTAGTEKQAAAVSNINEASAAQTSAAVLQRKWTEFGKRPHETFSQYPPAPLS